jgi:hypothetical protein
MHVETCLSGKERIDSLICSKFLVFLMRGVAFVLSQATRAQECRALENHEKQPVLPSWEKMVAWRSKQRRIF